MSYKPSFSQSLTLDGLKRWISSELVRISNALVTSSQKTKLEVATAEPAKPQTGEVVLADGTDWNPSDGRGLYYYDAGWQQVGSGGGGGGGIASEVNDLTTSVTWATVPDTYIQSTGVTQHQSALSITKSQISDLGTYLTSHQDISGKANLSGATFTGDVNIGTLPNDPENLNVTGNLTAYGDIAVTGTVDGVDVGNLKYHNVDYFMLRDGYVQHLSTSMVDIGTYTDIYDTATLMPTMRLLDLNASINWLDTIYNGNTYQNDVEIRLQLVVPTGTTNAVSLGSATQVSGGGYTVANSFQKWYYVSGDVTHHLSDFGKMHENSSGGSFERTLYGYQYHPTLDRTYFNMSTYPTVYATGTTVYWHPYQWESAGTVLTDYRYAREKGRSGSENVSLMYKTAYDDRALLYRIKIRELSASSTQPDRAQISQTMLQITKQEP